jgi:ankyrin repeat protein
METRKRRRDAAELAAKNFSLLDTLHSNLPEVFAAEILQKLDMTDTLSLAQVNKAYNDTVWSVEGVRSMEANIKAHLVNIDKKKNWITVPLYWAAKHGNVPAVRALLESGADVNKDLTSDKRTALHVAALHGHAALVKALIEAGADVNKTSSPYALDASGNRVVLHNVTPVYFAAQEGHTHVVMELIKAGADVNLATSSGDTPLFMAAHNGHESCVAVLIQAGADVRKARKNGWTPMKIATRNKWEKVVTLLKFYERV